MSGCQSRNGEGLIPDPKAHASTVADMMQRAAELNEGKEIANIRMHREQLAVVVAALRAYATAPSETADSKDAVRWRALKKLAGYYQDGSQQTVKLYQDDALRSCFIEAGRKTYGTDGSSFNSAIDEAMKDLTDE